MQRALAFVSCLAAVCLALSLPAIDARADLSLNEVLYDPAGPDDGLEFVELWNPDTIAVSLAGILVESGDGARPGIWAPLFAGAPGDSVPPRQAFLIAGSALLSTIQNGPDAVRLSRAGVVLDLVGYGALASTELYEGAPAADAASGQSLARIEDGRDTDSNAADWAPEPAPTPGRANHPDVRLSIARGSATVEPEVPWPGGANLRVVVRNRGRLSVPAARWRIEIALHRAGEGDSAWSAALAPVCDGVTLAAEESASVRCAFTAPAAGRFDLRAVLIDASADAGVSAIADTALIRSRSTASPLAVNEIAFRDRGAGEWVELIALTPVPDIGAYALSDAGGRAFPIERGPAARPAAAGEIFLVAQTPDLVRAAHALPESLVLGCRGGWGALNDTDRDDGFADRVRVVDSLGVPCDVVPYRSSYAERDGSIERLGVTLPSDSPNSWAESIDPHAGTPGRANSLAAPPHGAGSRGALLLASTRVVRRRAGDSVASVVLAFGDDARGRRVRVLVHDLLGRPRRLLVDGQRVLGDAAFVWDGRDDAGAPVQAGIYIVRAETIPDGNEPARSGNLALTVIGPWER